MQKQGDRTGEILFPSDPVPKKWWITFPKSWFDHSAVEFGSRSRIHIEFKDWRKRKDARTIRRAILDAVMCANTEFTQEGIVLQPYKGVAWLQQPNGAPVPHVPPHSNLVKPTEDELEEAVTTAADFATDGSCADEADIVDEEIPF